MKRTREQQEGVKEERGEVDNKKRRMKNEGTCSLFPVQVFASLGQIPGQDPRWLHPRATHIEFRSQGFRSSFRISGKVHAGLTKKLKACFYPDYQYTHPASTSSSTSSLVIKKKKSKFPQRDPQKAGMSRGNRLDQMLTKMLSFLEEYGLPHRVFNFRPVNVSKQTKEEILEQYSQWILKCNKNITRVRGAAVRLKSILNSKNKHIFLLWKQWDDQGYQLVATQLSVGLLYVCATNIDCVLRNAYNQYMIVEIKTGMEEYWHRPCESAGMMMKAPFEDVNDSPCNQALLQLAFGQLFYQQTFPLLKERLITAAVYRVTPKGVTTHYLPDLIKDRMNKALDTLIISSTKVSKR